MRGSAGAFLLRPRRPGLLLAGSFACALVWCLCQFDVGFLAGTSAYWQDPRGIVGNSFADISDNLSGYNYFVKDAWTLPLFHASRLGTPAGTTIIFTDSIPVVAIVGRLLYRATGQTVNLYGAWTALCFIGSALSMTGLVAIRGARGVAAALMATVAGLCMPALLARWGHISLMAQWQIPLALVVYFAARASPRPVRLAALSLLLAAFALWTNAYLFVMVGGILAATLAQAVLDRRLGIARAASLAAGFAVVLLGLLLLSGYVSGPGALAADGFGAYSMNLLSPIVPQRSGLFLFQGGALIDATGGQYEGFCYLGAGVLALLLATLPWLRRALAAAWPAHVCLLALIVGFCLFAISNQVFAGLWHVATIPLPGPVLALASVFRSSGRFVWPGLYALTATVIAATPAFAGRAAGFLLLAAAAMQIADTTPLRTALAASTRTAAASPLPQAAWAAAIRQHDSVRVVPPYLCLSDPRGLAAQIAIELELLASRENVATNTVYATRHRADCTPPDGLPVAAKELRVYLLTARRPAALPDGCASSSSIAVCSRQLGASGAAALLAGPP